MQMVLSPACAWEEIRLEESRWKVLTASAHSMIGLCGLSVFIGSLIVKGWGGPQGFQYVMIQCCAMVVSLFGGYLLAACLINRLCARMFAMDNDIPLTQQFADYALVAPFLLKIIIGTLPDFSIIALLFQFCIVYVMWEGSAILMKIAGKDCLRFIILSSILLVVCPAVIEFIFNKLMVVLN